MFSAAGNFAALQCSHPSMTFHPAFARLCAPLLLVVACLAGLPALAAGSAKEVVTTPHVRAELVAHAPNGVSPGATVWAGLQLDYDAAVTKEKMADVLGQIRQYEHQPA